MMMGDESLLAVVKEMTLNNIGENLTDLVDKTFRLSMSENGVSAITLAVLDIL